MTILMLVFTVEVATPSAFNFGGIWNRTVKNTTGPKMLEKEKIIDTKCFRMYGNYHELCGSFHNKS